MDEQQAAADVDHPSLRRVLGVRAVAAASFNGIVGVGIFGLPGLVAAVLGPAAILAYVICLVLIGLVGLCFAEAGSRVSDPGGLYAYARAAYGPVLSGVVGMLVLVANTLASSAALARFLVDALASLWPVLGGAVAGTALLAAMYAALAIVNIRGARGGARLTTVMAVIKLAPLLLLVVVGAAAIRPVNLAWPGMPGIAAIGQGAVILVFAFIGIETGLSTGGEAKDPARTIPRAILLTLVMVAALYIGLQLVAQGVLGPALASEPTPLVATATQVFGSRVTTLMVLLTAVSAGGYLVADTLGSPRVAFALAEHGQLPRVLAKGPSALRHAERRDPRLRRRRLRAGGVGHVQATGGAGKLGHADSLRDQLHRRAAAAGEGRGDGGRAVRRPRRRGRAGRRCGADRGVAVDAGVERAAGGDRVGRGIGAGLCAAGRADPATLEGTGATGHARADD